MYRNTLIILIGSLMQIQILKLFSVFFQEKILLEYLENSALGVMGVA